MFGTVIGFAILVACFALPCRNSFSMKLVIDTSKDEFIVSNHRGCQCDCFTVRTTLPFHNVDSLGIECSDRETESRVLGFCGRDFGPFEVQNPSRCYPLPLPAQLPVAPPNPSCCLKTFLSPLPPDSDTSQGPSPAFGGYRLIVWYWPTDDHSRTPQPLVLESPFIGDDTSAAPRFGVQYKPAGDSRYFFASSANRAIREFRSERGIPSSWVPGYAVGCCHR